MNWLGGYTGKTGYCGIAITPDDLYQAVDHRAGSAASVFFHWLGQHGKLAYPRLARYTFAKGMDYVAQAKHYRGHCKKAGIFRGLKDKIAENPNVARLIGTPVISFGICTRRERTFTYQCNRFTDTAKWVEDYRRQSGFADGMIHLDGWGWWGYDAMHPDILPPNMDAGGAAGLAELARRCKAAGLPLRPARPVHRLLLPRPLVRPVHVHRHRGRPARADQPLGRRRVRPPVLFAHPRASCSGTTTTASARCIRTTTTRRPSGSCAGRRPRTWTASAARWSAGRRDHLMTRTQSRKLQRKLLGIVRGGAEGEGIVLSCEHIRDFGVGVVDFSYAMSTMATDVVTTTGETTTAPIGLQAPLWELVFHDAVSLFCHTGRSKGMLYGQSPLVHLDGKPLAAEAIAQQKTLAAFHKQVALEEMTGHEILSADGSQAELHLRQRPDHRGGHEKEHLPHHRRQGQRNGEAIGGQILAQRQRGMVTSWVARRGKSSPEAAQWPRGSKQRLHPTD